MKRVRFLKTHLMYQPGETAGFAPDVADNLIAAGVAVDAAQMAEAETVAKVAAEAEAAAKVAAEAEAAAKPGKRS